MDYAISPTGETFSTLIGTLVLSAARRHTAGHSSEEQSLGKARFLLQTFRRLSSKIKALIKASMGPSGRRRADLGTP